MCGFLLGGKCRLGSMNKETRKTGRDRGVPVYRHQEVTGLVPCRGAQRTDGKCPRLQASSLRVLTPTPSNHQKRKSCKRAVNRGVSTGAGRLQPGSPSGDACRETGAGRPFHPVLLHEPKGRRGRCDTILLVPCIQALFSFPRCLQRFGSFFRGPGRAPLFFWIPGCTPPITRGGWE